MGKKKIIKNEKLEMVPHLSHEKSYLAKKPAKKFTYEELFKIYYPEEAGPLREAWINFSKGNKLSGKQFISLIETISRIRINSPREKKKIMKEIAIILNNAKFKYKNLFIIKEIAKKSKEENCLNSYCAVNEILGKKGSQKECIELIEKIVGHTKMGIRILYNLEKLHEITTSKTFSEKYFPSLFRAVKETKGIGLVYSLGFLRSLFRKDLKGDVLNEDTMNKIILLSNFIAKKDPDGGRGLHMAADNILLNSNIRPGDFGRISNIIVDVIVREDYSASNAISRFFIQLSGRKDFRPRHLDKFYKLSKIFVKEIKKRIPEDERSAWIRNSFVVFSSVIKKTKGLDKITENTVKSLAYFSTKKDIFSLVSDGVYAEGGPGKNLTVSLVKEKIDIKEYQENLAKAREFLEKEDILYSGDFLEKEGIYYFPDYSLAWGMTVLGKEKTIELNKHFGIIYFSRYPKTVLELLYESLQEKKSDKPVLFVISTQNDPNGAFYDNFDQLEGLLKGYKVLIAETNNEKDFYNKLKKISKDHGKINTLIIGGHGRSSRITLGGEGEQNMIDLSDEHELRKLKPLFEPNPIIILESCSTGWDDDSIGNLISAVLEARVFAPKFISFGGTYELNENGFIKDVKYTVARSIFYKGEQSNKRKKEGGNK